MNKHNLHAINELYIAPPKENGINENFYWAVHGNWPAIQAILLRHFTQPEAERRDAVLEEAAKACEFLASDGIAMPSGALRDAYAMDCAKAIRALKQTTPQISEGSK
jgi:hypothetical protein